ncbi:MAG TPA: hypothetical protein VEF71_08575 [Streptosporangiaceae bacterium]|nr:hypothetical protein [Streptosporangiaceae bacterium]
MHPELSQAVAAERGRELRTSAASSRRAAQLRSVRPGRRLLSFIGVPGAEHSRGVRQALRPLRDPRAA